MAILDILNRSESEFFLKTFKLELDYFSRDLGLLLNGKVSVLQPSFDYLTRDKIYPTVQKHYIKIDSVWEGECPGEVSMLVKVGDAKVMCGLMMSASTDDIKANLASEFSAEEAEIFHEIANQINGSMSNALRENFKFEFHATLKTQTPVTFGADADVFTKAFPAEGYMIVGGVLKMHGFPDSFLHQYIPGDMVRAISQKQGLNVATSTAPAPDDDDSKKGILLVDDDPVVRKIIKGFLRDVDVNIYEAGDGITAMQMLVRNRVHLVVLDIEMPNLSGIDTCKRIKHNAQTRNVPIVMCSSKSTRDNVLAAMNNGARDFLVKPINKKEVFLDRIMRYLQ